MTMTLTDLYPADTYPPVFHVHLEFLGANANKNDNRKFWFYEVGGFNYALDSQLNYFAED